MRESGFHAPMSPRIIQLPLSGRDRRAYVRELRRVEELHRDLVRNVAASYAAAHLLACEEWNARLFLGGDEYPSPQIQHAIDCGCSLLEVRCPHCRATRHVNLIEVIWPRDKPVHTLRGVLYCQPCRTATRRKARPQLIALCMPEPPATPQIAARKP